MLLCQRYRRWLEHRSETVDLKCSALERGLWWSHLCDAIAHFRLTKVLDVTLTLAKKVKRDTKQRHSLVWKHGKCTSISICRLHVAVLSRLVQQ